MYTKLKTQWHIHCCHRWRNLLYERLLNSPWSNIIDINAVVLYFPPVQTGPRALSASCKMGTSSFPGVKFGWGMLVTTHLLLVLRSWKSRVILLHTLRACNGIIYFFFIIFFFFYSGYVRVMFVTVEYNHLIFGDYVCQLWPSFLFLLFEFNIVCSLG